jgi:uncharacterized membrane protein
MRPGRIVRHLIADQGAVRRVLSAAALAEIGAAIAASERLHDGEIRFCIEAGLPWSYLRRDASARERALMLFSKLKVWDTERNTGVLIYVLLADRGIEIVADRGIARRVSQTTWDAVCAEMAQTYRAGRALEGTLAAIRRVSDALAEHFPPQPVNDNELPDQPVVL